jgi:hypothetical protein
LNRLIKLAIYLAFLGLTLLLVACTAASSVETTAELLPEIAGEIPGQGAEPHPEFEGISLTNLTDAEQPPTDECLICHLDKQRLIDTAATEVVVESESKGEG